MFGLAALTVAFVGLSELLGGGLDRPPPWASWLRIVLGTALIVVGVWRWLTRHRSAHAPAWLQAISNITPARAGGAGALLAVINPKVLFICLASGLTIGTAGLGDRRCLGRAGCLRAGRRLVGGGAGVGLCRRG